MPQLQPLETEETLTININSNKQVDPAEAGNRFLAIFCGNEVSSLKLELIKANLSSQV